MNHSKTVEKILNEMQNSMVLQKDTLDGLRHTSENTTIALNIIQNSLASMAQSLERHDKRSEYMNNDLVEISATLKSRPCVIEHYISAEGRDPHGD